MNLSDLAFACYVYGSLGDFDQSYAAFLDATGHSPDLTIAAHRDAVIEWLRSWGCRQFAIEYHDTASRELLAWHEQFGPELLGCEVKLWEVSHADFEVLAKVFNALSRLPASYREARGDRRPVSVGPTGAAKVLFAVRPKAVAPWDDPIRRSLGYDSSARSYVAYLRRIRSTLEDLSAECERNGLRLEDLPAALGRPQSTLPKLIDEYYWVTITKGCAPPGPELLVTWSQWSKGTLDG